MPEYGSTGDSSFIGLNSRDNPSSLQEGFLSSSKNIRLSRGIITARKGIKRLTPGDLVGRTVYGSCTYTDASGVDFIVLATDLSLFIYNTSTGNLNSSTGIVYPIGQTIGPNDQVDVIQALDKVWILRGYAKRPLMWSGVNAPGSVTVMPSGAGAYHKFPNGSSMIYSGNRLVVCQSAGWDKTTGTATGDVNDEITVSSYLDFTEFSLLDTFKINDGSNNKLVGVAPWVLNEFVAFMRNSIYYCSVGAGAEALGHSIDIADCYVKVLATDIGCVARKSIVQAAGGIIFLSDNGVYMMQPQNATTPEGMRAGVMGEPISAPIDDIIQRINVNYVNKAVASYYDNRYYLAVPLDNSTVNNAILVFNFINKAWESVDTFPVGFDIFSMHIARYGNRRRLYLIDQQQGIFVSDENESWDEYDSGSDALNTFNKMWFDVILFAPGTFNRYPIDVEAVTRGYDFQQGTEKRYSSVETDMNLPASTVTTTTVIMENPDSTTIIDNFNSPGTDTYSRLRPLRKKAVSAKVKYNLFNGRPSIKRVALSVVDPGRNLISRD